MKTKKKFQQRTLDLSILASDQLNQIKGGDIVVAGQQPRNAYDLENGIYYIADENGV